MNTQLVRPDPDAPPKDGSSFGAWLDSLMRLRGWSNAEVGRRIGVDGSLVSKWRLNRQRPDTWSCRLLADAFGVPVAEVLIHAGHVDPTIPLDDPIKDRMHDLIDETPSQVLEPYIDVFERLRELHR